MPNNFGGSQHHPDYTGVQLRARSKDESVFRGELYTLKGGSVEVEQIDGSIRRYRLDDESLPKSVQRRFLRLAASKQRKRTP